MISIYHSEKIKVGVSSCLLGHKVRYDGKDKRHDYVLKLCRTFDCIAICPECAVNLGVPRAPIHLVQIAAKIRARGIANPQQDVTDSLTAFADSIHQSIPDLCGYVFKARSPSCGVNSTPFFDDTGKHQLGNMSGIYSGRIQQLTDKLPIIEETQLTDDYAVLKFKEAVIAYATARLPLS